MRAPEKKKKKRGQPVHVVIWVGGQVGVGVGVGGCSDLGQGG